MAERMGFEPTIPSSRTSQSVLYYYKNMKRKKSVTQTQHEECYTKALTYVAQILVGAFFIAALIFPIF